MQRHVERMAPGDEARSLTLTRLGQEFGQQPPKWSYCKAGSEGHKHKGGHNGLPKRVGGSELFVSKAVPCTPGPPDISTVPKSRPPHQLAREMRAFAITSLFFPRCRYLSSILGHTEDPSHVSSVHHYYATLCASASFPAQSEPQLQAFNVPSCESMLVPYPLGPRRRAGGNYGSSGRP